LSKKSIGGIVEEVEKDEAVRALGGEPIKPIICGVRNDHGESGVRGEGTTWGGGEK